ncbi:phosphate ABC transporter substrate-binding protein PstS [Actinokineospora globicatena]|uniref:phosphate ABC transporter substrate-binding protein PstS n=1 Tax=Actinokineospora globicatena TaxID=103729 RepID=UPI0020A3A3C5|nr:phosphate ABC transporter substrate-binding protein PstS [Actinokineospora globicatena]MCP2301525.1 phosphate ABC transporter substrate-binding protein, PhoT family (TC 3.A.1.7.1) [Actinokineospora globicatena]GLW76828.1 phosphate-binding protein PstS [Actinokineospora globicatena]GLW83661.1 phosphate-binding protein PstS [Actinokineospora globicatena]
MISKRPVSVLGLVAAGALALTACGSDNNTPAGGNNSAAPAPTATTQVECGGKKDLVAEGSSAQKGAIEAFVAAYGAKCSGQQLAYTPSGSGAGVKQFTGGIVDIGGSDSPLNKDKGEVEKAAERCKGNPAWNLPLVFGPVGIAYKLDGVTSVTLTGEVAAKIFSGAVTKWNDPAIAAVNTGATLPDKAITVIYRGDESGTTDNFQKYLKAAGKGAWTKDAGKKFNGGVGQGAQGSAGVADAISAGDGTIGYIEWSYVQDKKLSAAKLDSGSGAVELGAQGAAAAIKSAKVKGEGHDLVLDLDALYASNTAGAYPLVLATYEIVCSKGYDADTAKAVKAFLNVAATDGQSALADAGYVPLPDEFQAKLLDAIKAIA